MAKRATSTATCECGHAGMWHTGTRCRIRDCDCTEFKHSVARRADGTWVDQGRPQVARTTTTRGHGPAA